ncbi:MULTISPECIES: DUF2147 domain-containing protein [Ruegeria]|uniref:DUF2147 domain-containing protein n=2 Tax=Ruegeria TaxID=97050 RepID=A0A6B2NW15_9RHOB|nr:MULTISPECIES: DUF2147 domain-containing protein [unclassified Ruegeria]MCU9840128.1 DUF2147 domain-containing protein [Ruegeria sp. WL0004]NDW46837.1 DUF2147 domain-containing protein [Ruegeria sp. PrR005]
MNRLILAAALGLGAASAALADPAAGTWKTEPGDTGGYLHVAVAPCGSNVCGTIKTAFDKDGAEQTDYEHKGKRMIWDMQPGGGGSYSGGQIWAPDSNKTYSSKMSLDGNALTVKGCVAGGLICRGQTWKRVN